MQEMARAALVPPAATGRIATILGKLQRSYLHTFLTTIVSATMCLHNFECRAQSEAFAATTKTASRTLVAVSISKEVQEVNVLLTATNWLGHFVKDLNQSDVRILDNGRPAERITYFQSQTNLPLRVGILIDASASVTNRFKFEQKSAAAFLQRVLRPGSDLAMLVGFNERPRLIRGLTDHHDLVAQGMKQFLPEGETAIYDAVAFACQELAKLRDSQPTRRALILITDGDDNRSGLSLQQAVEAALRSETIIYVLSTNPEYSLSLGDAGEKKMKELAEATGGRLLRAATDDNVSRAFSKIQHELRNQYAIGYKPPSARPDGLFHRLVVLGPKRLRLFHRQGYYASK